MNFALPKTSKKTKRIFHGIWMTVVYLFATAGFILIGGFFAIKYHVTDVPGFVDEHTQAYQQLATNTSTNTPTTPASIDTNTSIQSLDVSIADLEKIRQEKLATLCGISNLGQLYPVNAAAIFKQYQLTHSDALAQKMLFAATQQLTSVGKSIPQQCDAQTISEDLLVAQLANPTGANLYPWMNDEEWTSIHIAINKDKDVIVRAASVANIDPRLLTENLVVEQLRLFHTQRELFKKFFQPLNILGNSTTISLGVMGIKEATAKDIERHLQDPNSPYYLGPAYAHSLDLPATNTDNVRFSRLSNEHDHYYSYLYAALYLKQMLTQWKSAGFDIGSRPEIIGTLFNVGFSQSHPSATPKVGGSAITLNNVKYSFGSLAFAFYYSGDLADDFPLVTY